MIVRVLWDSRVTPVLNVSVSMWMEYLQNFHQVKAGAISIFESGPRFIELKRRHLRSIRKCKPVPT